MADGVGFEPTQPFGSSYLADSSLNHLSFLLQEKNMPTWVGRDTTQAMLLSQVLANLCHNQEVTASHRFTGRRPRNAPRWTPYEAPLMERCYHQRNGGTGKLRKTNATETLWREEWPNSWRITYNRPCVSYREPYPLPLSSVMVSCEKVSCYDTRYADQNQPMCICHSQPPFLFPARRKPTMAPTVRNSASL